MARRSSAAFRSIGENRKRNPRGDAAAEVHFEGMPRIVNTFRNIAAWCVLADAVAVIGRRHFLPEPGVTPEDDLHIHLPRYGAASIDCIRLPNGAALFAPAIGASSAAFAPDAPPSTVCAAKPLVGVTHPGGASPAAPSSKFRFAGAGIDVERTCAPDETANARRTNVRIVEERVFTAAVYVSARGISAHRIR
ncbi:MAG: hypothetical protein QOE82_2379 [Thermoanaerobaculia bacterium]|nr:hypothetical protein [Thermoanaerobaculia bacterium]